jgi:hypothetical protein
MLQSCQTSVFEDFWWKFYVLLDVSKTEQLLCQKNCAEHEREIEKSKKLQYYWWRKRSMNPNQ